MQQFLCLQKCVAIRLINKSETLKILVITKTDGYRHECIPVALEILSNLAKNNSWEIANSDDPAFLLSDSLVKFDVVVFLQTTGNILDTNQQLALQSFIEGGKGLVTIHSGTVTENNWDWYVNAIGAKFTGHPPVQKGELIIEDREHPATIYLPDSTWVIEDEWYSFDRIPRNSVRVLISIDESSYEVDDNKWFKDVNQSMGDHPLVWCKLVGDGRVFQTALGHSSQIYSDINFQNHLIGAINWSGNRN